MKRNRVEVVSLTPKERLSVVANAIGFAMFGRDGRPIRVDDDGNLKVDLTNEEVRFCHLVAARVLEHLEASER